LEPRQEPEVQASRVRRAISTSGDLEALRPQEANGTCGLPPAPLPGPQDSLRRSTSLAAEDDLSADNRGENFHVTDFLWYDGKNIVAQQNHVG